MKEWTLEDYHQQVCDQRSARGAYEPQDVGYILAQELGDLMGAFQDCRDDWNKVAHRREEFRALFGDVLWALCAAADVLGLDLSNIAQDNVKANFDRAQRLGTAPTVLTLSQFQKAATETDDYMLSDELSGGTCFDIAFLGLAGHVGGILLLLKRRARNGAGSQADFSTTIGAALWFLTKAIRSSGEALNKVADASIENTARRWTKDGGGIPLGDEYCRDDEQIPRKFKVRFQETPSDDGRAKVKITFLTEDGQPIDNCADHLSDNARDADHYSYHDVLHLAYAAILGWSPVLRHLIGRKRKSSPVLDEVDDGARARDLEEGITAFVYEHAKQRDLFVNTKQVDRVLLRTVISMVAKFESDPRLRSIHLWERAILEGFSVLRELAKVHRNGEVTVDLQESGISVRRIDAPENERNVSPAAGVAG